MELVAQWISSYASAQESVKAITIENLTRKYIYIYTDFCHADLISAGVVVVLLHGFLTEFQGLLFGDLLFRVFENIFRNITTADLFSWLNSNIAYWPAKCFINTHSSFVYNLLANEI